MLHSAERPDESGAHSGVHSFGDTEVLSALVHDLPWAQGVLDRRAIKQRDDWRGSRRFERVVLATTDGGRRSAFLKWVRGPESRGGEGLDTEGDVYRRILPEGPVGPAAFLGMGRSRGSTPTGALMLEWIDAGRLKNRQQPEAWRAAAKWLAACHAYFTSAEAASTPPSERIGLPVWNHRYLTRRADRIMDALGRHSPAAARLLERDLSRYETAARILSTAPRTLVHGEYYCTNIFIEGDPVSPRRVCPFDWETAAFGCGAFDVACLSRQRLGFESEIETAYEQGLTSAGSMPSGGSEELGRQLLCARLQESLEEVWRAVQHRRVGDEKLLRYVREFSAACDRL